jgi:hypothetical protein
MQLLAHAQPPSSGKAPPAAKPSAARGATAEAVGAVYRFQFGDMYEIEFKTLNATSENEWGQQEPTPRKKSNEGRATIAVEQVLEDGSARVRVQIDSFLQRIPDPTTGELTEDKDKLTNFATTLVLSGAATCVISPTGRMSQLEYHGRDSAFGREMFFEPVILLFAPLREEGLVRGQAWDWIVPSLWASDDPKPERVQDADRESITLAEVSPERVVLRRIRASAQMPEAAGGAAVLDRTESIRSRAEVRTTLKRDRNQIVRPERAEGTRRVRHTPTVNDRKYRLAVDTDWTVSVTKFVERGGDAAVPEVKRDALQEAPDVRETPIVDFVGHEPLFELRPTPKIGDTHPVRLTIQTGNRMTLGSRAEPKLIDVEMSGSMKVLKVGAEEAEYELHVVDVQPGELSRKLDADELEQIKMQFDGMKDQRFQFALPWTLAQAAARASGNQTGPIQSMLKMLIWTSPGQPIGVGARWRHPEHKPLEEQLTGQGDASQSGYEVTGTNGDLVNILLQGTFIQSDDDLRVTTTTKRDISVKKDDPLPWSMDSSVEILLEKTNPKGAAPLTEVQVLRLILKRVEDEAGRK